MPFLRSRVGAGLAILYLAVALWVVQEELRHSGGGWISLRGMLTGIVTAPSQATLGTALRRLGVPRVDFGHPGAPGYAELAAHVLLTAALVYLVGCLLGWGAESIGRRWLH